MFLSPALMSVSVALAVQASMPVSVTTDERPIHPGDVVVLTLVTAAPADSVTARAFGRAVLPFKIDATTWQVLVGIDLETTPGPARVTIGTIASGQRTETVHDLVVRPKQFPTRRLTVNSAFVHPPASVEARIATEASRLSALWETTTATRYWRAPFIRPVPQAANSAFGARSILNGVPRSPHGGADFASPAGTRVVAPNAGRVVLAGALYYTGNTVVIDHGSGLLSLFAHLSTISVAEGDDLARGAFIGRVGATGRVTGPHLHWTVRANGARVDPLSLLAVLGRQN